MSGSSSGALARRFLLPRSIAILGATSAAHKAGGRRWLSALEASGETALYPINMSASELDGRKVYRSLRALPEPVDLAVIVVPGPHVAQAVEDCAATGVGAVVMISAGFGETGPEGKAEEARLVERVRAGGGRMLGPNSAGVFSAAGGVNVLGWPVPQGSIGLVTQSGNMALTFTNYARAKRTGFASIVAVGNAADLRLSEAIEMLIADAATRAVLVYCEGFAAGDGRRLIEVLRQARGAKPVVMLRPGASEAGKAAAQSHTGMLAGDDAVAGAALAAAGVVQAAEAEEAFDIAHALATGRRLSGRGIAVLSDGGGHATIVADCAGRRGLHLARFAPATAQRLREILPMRAGIDNPVDFAGVAESDPRSVPAVLEACLGDPNVAGVIFAGHFGGYHAMTRHEPTRVAVGAEELEAARAIATAVSASTRPVILHSEHAETDLPTLAPIFAAGVPVYRSLELAAKAMAALAAGLAPESAGEGDLEASSPGLVLLEPAARQRLQSAGVPVPPWRTAASAGEARDAYALLAAEGTAKVAMKLVSAAAVHKSDVGGVLLDVGSSDAAAEGCERLLAIAHRLGDAQASVLLTPMIAKGIECLVGARRDPQFGPIVLLGAGGVLVELLHDVASALAPFDAAAARELIARTKVSHLLRGYRGGAAVDQDAFASLVAAVSKFAATTPDLIELDLNPVIVNAAGAHIADARMVVRPGPDA